MSQKLTSFTAPNSQQRGEWYVIDAEGLVLGRLAVEIANRLRGKHKPSFHNGADHGDHIVVLNADKILVTGQKATDKVYYRHTGYPGGIKSETFTSLQEKKPGGALEIAVKRMLPRTKLRSGFMKKLCIYNGTTHPHTAQKPKLLQLDIN